MGNFPYEGEVVQPTPVPEDINGEAPVEDQQAPLIPETLAPDVVTLIVTPQDAVTLNNMIFNGAQLTLALRASGDASRVDTESVTLQFLMDQYNIPVPIKLPYGLNPRVDGVSAPVLKNDIPTPEP
jgi:pilus assembly protein CpaB